MAELSTSGFLNTFGLGNVSGAGILNTVGWIVAGVIILAVAGIGFWVWYQKKYIYNKVIEINEIVGDTFIRTGADMAKTVKLGTGGFQILYLKKMKVWKIAYGSRVGKNTYTFYILPDGYWYNARPYAKLQQIDELKGMIPVVTTNPMIRGQYTALEKQIDHLHEQKKGFWDGNKTWIVPLIFIIIMGTFMWLAYREVGAFLGQSKESLDMATKVLETSNRLLVNANSVGTNSGLVPAGG